MLLLGFHVGNPAQFFFVTVVLLHIHLVIEKIVYVPSETVTETKHVPVPVPIYLNERQEEVVRQKTNEILGYTAIGASIGSSIGSVIPVVGTFIGGAIGAGIGFLFGRSRSKNR